MAGSEKAKPTLYALPGLNETIAKVSIAGTKHNKQKKEHVARAANMLPFRGKAPAVYTLLLLLKTATEQQKAIKIQNSHLRHTLLREPDVQSYLQIPAPE